MDVDPDAAAAHASLIVDPGLRSRIVAYLLDNPRAERRMSRRRWRLEYDGLVEQLRGPLTEPLLQDTGPHLGNPVARRAHTAVEIARSSRLLGAVPEIQALVEEPGLNPVLRASAAYALKDLDEGKARQVLASILPELAEHPDHDPDDDLRGTALDACWPQALTVSELVAAMGRPARENYFGSYAMFLNGLVEHATDPEVVELVRELGADRHDGTELGDSPRTAFGLFDEQSKKRRRERRLATSLLERVVATDLLGDVLSEAAWLMVNLASLHEKPELPERLLDRTTDSPACRLRRALVREGLRFVSPRRAPLLLWMWRVPEAAQPSWGRGGLLCGDDLPWLFELGLEAGRAEHATSLLSAVFDPDDPDQQEVAWRHRDHPLFPKTVGWWFEAVPLDGDRATDLREQHQMMNEVHSWDASESHAEALEDAWRQCREVEPEAFKTLCILLSTAPETGFVEFQNQEPEAWPSSGIAAFDRATFDAAALRYLKTADPSEEDWTRTTDSISWTALAGYAALRELARGAEERPALSDLDDSALTKWAAVILRCPYRVLPENSELSARLVDELRDRLPLVYVKVAMDWIRVAVAAGESPHGLDDLALPTDGPVVDELVELSVDAVMRLDGLARELSEIDTDPTTAQRDRLHRAQETVRSLIVVLSRSGRPTALEWQRISNALPDECSTQTRAMVLNEQLQSAAIEWSKVLVDLRENPELGESFVLEAIAGRREPSWWRALSEVDLGTLLSWLIDRWGADSPPIDLPTRGDRIKDWRDGVLNELAGRSTTEALTVLAGLRDANPSSDRLSRIVDEAEERQRDESWVGPTPQNIASLVADARRTLVLDDDDMYRLLLSVLERLPTRLDRLGQLLWNEAKVHPIDGSQESVKVTGWTPKYEADISAFVADHLTSELAGGIVVNREVLVRQTSSKGHGLAVDVLATSGAGSGRGVVPIEIKGGWNSGLLVDLKAQLVDDYMPALNSKRGIYLCAWFSPDAWSEGDSRRRVAAARDRDGVEQELREQAEGVKADGMEVAVVVVDVPRPQPSSRARSGL